jgi:hypothetical protein
MRWSHNRGNCFYICLDKENTFKIFFSRTNEPEKLKFARNLSDIVQQQVCENHCPEGWVGPQLGTQFLHVVI